MKSKNIVIIQGHPDPEKGHYCHALARAYAEGAVKNGHQVETIVAAEISVPFLKNQSEFNQATRDVSIIRAQKYLQEADHMVIIYPLWLGTMPAVLKNLLEHVLRPNVAFSMEASSKWPRKLLKDKSARVIITMGMPAWIYRWVFHAHSLKSLEQNILKFVGFAPVRHCIIGQIDSSDKKRRKWLDKIQQLGEASL